MDLWIIHYLPRVFPDIGDVAKTAFGGSGSVVVAEYALLHAWILGLGHGITMCHGVMAVSALIAGFHDLLVTDLYRMANQILLLD